MRADFPATASNPAAFTPKNHVPHGSADPPRVVQSHSTNLAGLTGRLTGTHHSAPPARVALLIHQKLMPLHPGEVNAAPVSKMAKRKAVRRLLEIPTVLGIDAMK